MSLNANAILQLDEAREELKESSQKYDSIIERRINGLSATFDSRTGWAIAPQSLTSFRVDGNQRGSQAGGGVIASALGGTGFGGSKYYILIPIVPVRAVTKIVIHQDWDDSVYATITDTTTFLLKGLDRYAHSLSGRLQLFNDVFLNGHCNVALDMTVGFSDSHPKLAEAKRLMMMQLQYEYKRWQNNEAGLISRSLPDGSISFAPPSSLLREVEDGLMNMKSWRFC